MGSIMDSRYSTCVCGATYDNRNPKGNEQYHAHIAKCERYQNRGVPGGKWIKLSDEELNKQRDKT